MVTSVSVTFINGKRMLAVDINFQSALTVEVPDPAHCAELLGLLWTRGELEPREWEEMTRIGGGIALERSMCCPQD